MRDENPGPSAAMVEFVQLLNTLGEHAADIAHARRVLFDAYRAEGFSDAQALELCKVLLT